MRTVLEYKNYKIVKLDFGQYEVHRLQLVKKKGGSNIREYVTKGYFSSIRSCLVKLRDEVASKGGTIQEMKELLAQFDKDFKEVLAVIKLK